MATGLPSNLPGPRRQPPAGATASPSPSPDVFVPSPLLRGRGTCWRAAPREWHVRFRGRLRQRPGEVLTAARPVLALHLPIRLLNHRARLQTPTGWPRGRLAVAGLWLSWPLSSDPQGMPPGPLPASATTEPQPRASVCFPPLMSGQFCLPGAGEVEPAFQGLSLFVSSLSLPYKCRPGTVHELPQIRQLAARAQVVLPRVSRPFLGSIQGGTGFFDVSSFWRQPASPRTPLLSCPSYQAEVG